MAHRHVGIDLGTHHVKLAVVSAGFRGVTVEDIVELPVVHEDGDPSGLDSALATALAALEVRNLGPVGVGIALPGALGSYRTFRFPFHDAKRIAQTVQFEADGQFPVSLDELEFDHVPSAVPGGGGQALVAAIEHRHFDGTVSAARGAGLDLKLVTLGPCAVAQVVGGPVVPAPPVEEGEPTPIPVALVVDVGHRATQFLAITDKQAVAARTFRYGGRNVTAALARIYRMDAEQAEEAKHRDAFLPHQGLAQMSEQQLEAGRAVAQATEPLVRELEHTRRWLLTRHGYTVTEIRVCGGGARLGGIAEYLAEQTSLPVSPARPRDSLRLGERDFGSALAAVGAAIGCAKRPVVQLYDVTTVQRDRSWVQQHMGTLAAMGMSILGFGALDTIVQKDAIEARQAVYEAELEEATRGVFGVPLTSLSEIEEKLEAVKGKDLSALVPQRGALEVLAMITEAATPHDSAAANGAEAGEGGGPLPPGAPPDRDMGPDGGRPAGAEVPDDDEPDRAAGGPAPVSDPSKGIYADDDLYFEVVEIRERKLDLKVSALRSSAQDRLAMKLQEGGCLQNVQKGKVRDQNDRKVFEMNIDNACYFAAETEEEE